MRRRSLLLVLLLGWTSRPVSAAPADLSKLFAYEGDIVLAQADGAGDGEQLLRLVLPTEVTSASRADLSDVRVFDSHGAEVPFVVDSGLRSGEVRKAVDLFEARVLDVRRSEVALEGEPSLYREEYDLEVPPPPESGSRWEMVFGSDRDQFIRAVQIVAVGDGGETPLLDDGTIFRLKKTRVERISIVVPEFEGPRLRVVLEGADGFFLEPTIQLRTTTVFDSGEPAVVPLEVLARRQEGGRTYIEVARPDGVVPDLLRLETETSSYYRPVEVIDLRQGGGEGRLGSGTVFRVKLRQRVEANELRLSPARGSAMRLEILDEDSPPLAELKVSAVVRRPVLYFHLPGTGGAVAGVLRYGGGRVDRARYDLDQLSPPESVARGQVARLGAMLLDRTQTQLAEVQHLRPNPNFDPSPLLAFAMQPGAAVHVGDFSHRRAIRVEPSADGLTRLRLQPEDLAVARADLGDVRIVDAEGRQWPYLLHRGAGVTWVDVAVAPPVRADRVSRYSLHLPYAPLPLESLELGIDMPFFSRGFRVLADGGGDRGPEALAQGKLSRIARHQTPAVIGLTGLRVDELALLVDDGDEASLPVTSARGSVRVPDVYLTAPSGDYFLLLGDAKAAAPRYDLADAREAVLAVSSQTATAGALEVNPTHGWRQKLVAGDRDVFLQRAAVWVVLAMAVLALALVTVRLVRKEAA